MFLLASATHPYPHSFPTRRSSDLLDIPLVRFFDAGFAENAPTESQAITRPEGHNLARYGANMAPLREASPHGATSPRSEEHTSELQSQSNLVCRLLLEKKKKKKKN